jgi:deazaflavin-dependent oxidoreductase (nitroreductase family)
VEDDLVARGRVLRLETVGRITARPALATVGFVERADGSLAISAGSPASHWARNLLASPACRVTIADVSFRAVAHPLTGADHAATVRSLIVKYGTPAEGLGSGPSFALVRDDGRRGS